MTPDIEQRILTAEDYDAVCVLWEAAGLHIRPVGRDSREAFTAQIASGSQVVIGLENSDRLIGVVVATTGQPPGVDQPAGRASRLPPPEVGPVPDRGCRSCTQESNGPAHYFGPG